MIENRLNSFIVFLLLLFIGACYSCGSEKHQESNESAQVQLRKEHSLSLDAITDLPAEIDGCSCYFSRNQKVLEKQEYIYVNDLAQTSFISVGKKLEKLALKTSSDSTAESKFYIYANEKFELKVEIDSVTDLAEELTGMGGNLVLKDLKTGQVSTFPFIGECGC
jgi:hypothetical protein